MKVEAEIPTTFTLRPSNPSLLIARPKAILLKTSAFHSGTDQSLDQSQSVMPCLQKKIVRAFLTFFRMKCCECRDERGKITSITFTLCGDSIKKKANLFFTLTASSSALQAKVASLRLSTLLTSDGK